MAGCKMAGETGVYVLRNSPHPFNSALKGTKVWQSWELHIPGRQPRMLPHLNNRAVGADELRRRRQEKERADAAIESQRQARESQQQLEEQLRRENAAAEKKRQQQERWGKIDNMFRKTQAPRIEFKRFGDGSKEAPDGSKVRQQQEADERELVQQLHSKWARCRDDETCKDLQWELARLRCALHHHVDLSWDFWTSCCNDSLLQWVREEETRLDAMAQEALQAAKSAKEKVKAEELTLLFNAVPDAKTAEVGLLACLLSPVRKQPVLMGRVCAYVCVHVAGGSKTRNRSVRTPDGGNQGPTGHRFGRGQCTWLCDQWLAWHDSPLGPAEAALEGGS